MIVVHVFKTNKHIFLHFIGLKSLSFNASYVSEKILNQSTHERNDAEQGCCHGDDDPFRFGVLLIRFVCDVILVQVQAHLSRVFHLFENANKIYKKIKMTVPLDN